MASSVGETETARTFHVGTCYTRNEISREIGGEAYGIIFHIGMEKWSAGALEAIRILDAPKRGSADPALGSAALKAIAGVSLLKCACFPSAGNRTRSTGWAFPGQTSVISKKAGEA